MNSIKQEKNMIYVLDKDGNPLDPTYRNHKVRELLVDKKAFVKYYKPYTIQLLYEPETKITGTHIAAIDPGRTNIGTAVVDENGVEEYAAHITTRNKEVPKKMKERAEHRRNSRSGERKVRQRQAKRNGTIFPFDEKHPYVDNTVRERILPKCENPIHIKYISNTEAKYCNRMRPDGWHCPTVNQLLQTHINSVELMCDILPITDFVLEINKFNFERLQHSNIKPWEYGNGPLKNTTVEELVAEEQNHHCLLCKNEIEHYHHIVHQSKNGSNTVSNLVGLCKKHHNQVHNNKKVEQKVLEKKEGLEKQFDALSVLNQIFKSFIEYLILKFGEEHVFFTDGKTTATFRANHQIDKSHHNDAYCIACSILENVKIDYSSQVYEIKQFRRYNRQLISARRERKYYEVEDITTTKILKNGKEKTITKQKKTLVATNRHKLCNQKTNSLRQYYQKLREEYDKQTSKQIVSRLVVEKGLNRYRDTNLIMPGAVFIYEGKHYVLSGNSHYGQYYMAIGCGAKTFPAKKCKIVQKNKGLVYLY